MVRPGWIVPAGTFYFHPPTVLYLWPVPYHEKYEAVIGLEVHAQLQTASKLFCSDSVQFGAEPNSQVSPISLAHPGTLPKTNEKAIGYALRLGLALGCQIERENYFARKHYFYPDLPKAYQISQHTTPICNGGGVPIRVGDQERVIRLNRIHMEEDAGKSIHDFPDAFTRIDLNRAGTPLLEIVSEPDLHSPDEAYAYLSTLRRLVQWLGICDGNMEEGSMRCDANISIRLHGETKLGTRVEVKNLNSVRNLKKAVEIEIHRLIELVESGQTIRQETRSFDADNQRTFTLRSKEDAEDYRYFPDPDLAPFHLTDADLRNVQEAMPELPWEKEKRYQQDFQLSTYDAEQLTVDAATASYFEALMQAGAPAKAAANWLMGPIRAFLNEHQLNFPEFTLAPASLAALIHLVESGKVGFTPASTRLLQALVADPTQTPDALAQALNLFQESDTNTLESWIQAVLDAFPDKVQEYKKGKKGVLGLFAGEVKKRSKGKADMNQVTQLLQQKLND